MFHDVICLSEMIQVAGIRFMSFNSTGILKSVSTHKILSTYFDPPLKRHGCLGYSVAAQTIVQHCPVMLS